MTVTKIVIPILLTMAILLSLKLIGVFNQAVIISDIAINNITGSSVSLSWRTNVPSVDKVEYVSVTSTAIFTPVEVNYATQHTFTLTALDSDQIYQFKIYATDKEGNQSISKISTFKTLQAFLTYTDYVLRFSIEYPQSWSPYPKELVGSGILAGFISPVTCKYILPEFNVANESLPYEMSASAYLDLSLPLVKKKMDQYVKISTEEVNIGESIGIRHVYTTGLDNKTLVRQYLLVNHKTGWIITLKCATDCQDKFINIFDHIGSSFRYLD
jgi:hypothetical protein